MPDRSGLEVNRLSTAEFDGPPRQVEPLTVEVLRESSRRVSGTDVTITTMSSRTRWIDTAAAAAWTGRVNSVAARTDPVDVDALLVRRDGCVAWALPTGQDLDATTVVRALGTWFGQPA
ncbi:hypothetical protein [Micromonospora sp. NPDC048839]|uniref:aromatic-ring hydroxylase C-terminal domain-containing protein n=1 Tax=Micromonospora sp. NPDC048839 TaxID=3155641 RepID=UPI0033C65FB2